MTKTSDMEGDWKLTYGTDRTDTTDEKEINLPAGPLQTYPAPDLTLSARATLAARNISRTIPGWPWHLRSRNLLCGSPGRPACAHGPTLARHSRASLRCALSFLSERSQGRSRGWQLVQLRRRRSRHGQARSLCVPQFRDGHRRLHKGLANSSPWALYTRRRFFSAADRASLRWPRPFHAA